MRIRKVVEISFPSKVVFVDCHDGRIRAVRSDCIWTQPSEWNQAHTGSPNTQEPTTTKTKILEQAINPVANIVLGRLLQQSELRVGVEASLAPSLFLCRYVVVGFTGWKGDGGGRGENKEVAE